MLFSWIFLPGTKAILKRGNESRDKGFKSVCKNF